jgi:DNA-damage-inducible protein J
MANTSVTIRMDSKLKKQAEELFSDLGLNMTSAMNTFARQAVREQSIPFKISRNIPNQETVKAMNEIKDMKENPDKYKGYENADEMMKDILG